MVDHLLQGCIERGALRLLYFGHRHLAIDFKLGASRYIHLGDWIRYNTYAVFDGQQLSLLAQSPSMDQKIIRK